ncbi:branched-chain amino acid ABC transporter permease [Candidatus Parcubacteria bacterium]|jgi:branched-chain amino acid transport system permease protein|nr:branched-chain amino acid ABC transporter permease [Candidatus Parcubacteria bacterium]MBT3949273.1 branched-chain amino acid ABC transporter permease [Candidatus Parcubacteria bacterium]
MFFQLLINGLIAGSIYALIASGFSIIYTTNKFVHFAHGSTATVAAYFLYWIFSNFGLPLYLVFPLTILIAALFGFLVHLLIYLPLKKRKSSSVILLIASLALMAFFDNLMQLLFGADVKILSIFPHGKGIEILGAYITPIQIVILIVVLLLFFGLWAFSKYSKLGKIMRAVSDNPELAKTTGINSIRVQHWSFVIGSAIAGLAGILIALEHNIEPAMGTHLMIQGFTAAVIGGVTSIPGSIVGAYVLGLTENFGIWFLPSGYKSAIAFVLLLIFLIIRPQGIFGINQGNRDQKM